jgi:hypothetical protein
MSIGQGIDRTKIRSKIVDHYIILPKLDTADSNPPKVESPPRGATALKPIKTTPKFTSIEES